MMSWSMKRENNMKKLLVVDDNLQNRRLMERKLNQWGVVFSMASNGEEALSAVKKEEFSLILMDINLPRTDQDDPINYLGMELSEEILASSPSPKPVIVAITAHGMDAQRKAILNSGITSIIQKGREDYYHRILECLQSHGIVESELIHKPTFEVPLVAMVSSASSTPPIAPSAYPNTQSTRFEDSIDQTLVAPDEPQVESLDGIGSIAKALDRMLQETKEFMHLLPAASECLPICNSICGCLEHTIVQLRAPASSKRDSNFGHWFTNQVVALPADLQDLKTEAAKTILHSPSQIDGWIASLNTILSHVHQISGRTAHSDRSSADAKESDSGKVQNDLSDPQPVVPLVHNNTIAVLIVDDEPAAREDLARKTRKLGYLAIPCDSGTTAIELLQRMHFDICLVDMAMPDMDGMQFIHKVKNRPELSHIPIVVVSGSCTDATGSQAIEAGAADYLSKPAQIEVLKARITYCLRSSEQRRLELSKFLPPHIARELLSDDSILKKPKFCDITVMVCDIRGFSKICETRHPGDTIRWISDVMNSLSEIILKSGGTIVDYVGDEIMAMWGAPVESDNHPEIATRCALELQQEVQKLSEKWLPELQAPLAVGIGIHSGLAVCGNTGSQRRIKYGPLGNTVNLASRVQGTTKYLRSSILVTNETRNRIKKDLVSRRVCRIRVNNLKEPVELFELSDPLTRKQNQKFFQSYQETLAAFECSSGDEESIQSTLASAAQLLAENPNDGPARLLMSRILQVSLGYPFDPVWTMIGK